MAWARGHRLGTRLVDAWLAFARSAGYSRVTLWTKQRLHHGLQFGVRHAGMAEQGTVVDQ